MLGRLCSLLCGEIAQLTSKRILVEGHVPLIKMIGHNQLLSSISTVLTLPWTATLPSRNLHGHLLIYQINIKILVQQKIGIHQTNTTLVNFKPTQHWKNSIQGI